MGALERKTNDFLVYDSGALVASALDFACSVYRASGYSGDVGAMAWNGNAPP